MVHFSAVKALEPENRNDQHPVKSRYLQLVARGALQHDDYQVPMLINPISRYYFTESLDIIITNISCHPPLPVESGDAFGQDLRFGLDVLFKYVAVL